MLALPEVSSALPAGTRFAVLACLMVLSAGITLRSLMGVTHKRKLKKRIPFLGFLQRARPYRLKGYQDLAAGVIRDVEEALEVQVPPHYEARALIPLVCEVRKRGELLIQSRKVIYSCLFPFRERRLCPLVNNLIQLEKRLKSLPRPNLSLEDVLAGNFNWQSGCDGACQINPSRHPCVSPEGCGKSIGQSDLESTGGVHGHA